MCENDRCCLICWAFWVSPVAVFLIDGCGIHFWINMFLFFFTLIGGFLHALCLIYMLSNVIIVSPVVATPVVATPIMPPPVVATPIMPPPVVATPIMARPAVAAPVATTPVVTTQVVGGI